MVLFYLTVTTLDIALGVTWWFTKTTAKGVYYCTYYLLYGPEPQRIYNKKDLVIEMNKIQKQIEYIK